MRMIELEMNDAIKRGIDWRKDNTGVVQFDNGEAYVFLCGKHIATVKNGEVKTIKSTLMQYPTRTTMSRLRALGVDVCTKRGDVYLDGVNLCEYPFTVEGN